MKDNGLQGIAVEARNRKSGPGIFQTIGAIIFILPIIIHGFKWGWVYPILALLALGILPEALGDVLGIILGVLLVIGSIWLCKRRVLTMRRRRKQENIPRLYTPPNMRDYD